MGGRRGYDEYDRGLDTVVGPWKREAMVCIGYLARYVHLYIWGEVNISLLHLEPIRCILAWSFSRVFGAPFMKMHLKIRPRRHLFRARTYNDRL